MKPTISLAICLAASLAAQSALADTCQWKDAGGRTVVSDTPPAGKVKDLRCVGDSGGASGSSAAPSAKSSAEQNADFKKRQQEGKEKADKVEKEKTAAEQRKENCDRAKRQVALLESGQRLATVDEKGERQILDDAGRQQEIERARQVVNDACK